MPLTSGPRWSCLQCVSNNGVERAMFVPKAFHGAGSVPKIACQFWSSCTAAVISNTFQVRRRPTYPGCPLELREVYSLHSPYGSPYTTGAQMMKLFVGTQIFLIAAGRPRHPALQGKKQRNKEKILARRATPAIPPGVSLKKPSR